MTGGIFLIKFTSFISEHQQHLISSHSVQALKSLSLSESLHPLKSPTNWKIEIESPTKQGALKRGTAQPTSFWASSSSFSLDLLDLL
jgi:hypothetical protein